MTGCRSRDVDPEIVDVVVVHDHDTMVFLLSRNVLHEKHSRIAPIFYHDMLEY